MATGVSVEIDGVVVEFMVWLRKKSDYNHINVAELDATIKAVNLALKWGPKEIEIRTDSVTFRSWIHSVITNEKRARTKRAAREIADEFELKLSVVFVPSNRKKADSLTMVWKRWLKVEEYTAVMCYVGQEEGKELHNLHYVGVNITVKSFQM